MLSFKYLHDAITKHGHNDFSFNLTKDKSRAISWIELQNNYITLANQLLKMDLPENPVIGILSSTRYEWNVSDFAIQSIEGITVGLYKNDRDSIISNCLDQTCPSLLILESHEDLKRIQAIDSDWGWVRPVVIMDSHTIDSPPIYSFKSLLNKSISNSEYTNIALKISQQNQDRVSSYIFTSGTSGLPKATVLSSKNLIHSAQCYSEKYQVSSDDSTILYLPFSHVFSRVMFYASILWGQKHHYLKNIENLPIEMKRVNPSILLVVPRLLEKVMSKISESLIEKNIFERTLFKVAIYIGRKRNLESKNGLLTSTLYPILDKLVLKQLREIFGKKLKFMGAGGGRLNKTTADFFWSIGLPIYEGYASTETGGLGIFNHPKSFKTGSIGIPSSAVNWKIENDNELTIQSPSNALGYLKNGQIEMFETWLPTGDIAGVDEQGFISIKDRKKDIFVSAYGKNIAPGWIEEQFKQSQYIEDIVIAGDEKPFLTALIVPSENFKQHSDLTSIIQKEVLAINKKLSRHETLKSFRLIEELSIDDATMTSTFKKRRMAILNHYQDKIDSMYPVSDQAINALLN